MQSVFVWNFFSQLQADNAPQNWLLSMQKFADTRISSRVAAALLSVGIGASLSAKARRRLMLWGRLVWPRTVWLSTICSKISSKVYHSRQVPTWSILWAKGVGKDLRSWLDLAPELLIVLLNSLGAKIMKSPCKSRHIRHGNWITNTGKLMDLD